MSIVESAPPALGRTIHLNAQEVPAVFRRAFPGYKGRRWRVRVAESVTLSQTYWSGGSKSTYRLLRLDNGATAQAPVDSPFDQRGIEGNTYEIPEGFAVVEHSRFCGKDMGLTIHAGPENLRPLLPAPEELSDHLRAALNIIGGIKGGHHRRDEWERRLLPGQYGPNHAFIVELEAKGLVKVNKAGAVSITTAGRNAR
jgi:hypothetical protein